MTKEERLAKAREWHDRYVLEAAERETRLAELQEKLTVAQSRIDSIVAKVTDVKNNLAYRLLPSWIKTKIENLIDWTDGE